MGDIIIENPNQAFEKFKKITKNKINKKISEIHQQINKTPNKNIFYYYRIYHVVKQYYETITLSSNKQKEYNQIIQNKLCSML